MFPNNTLGTRHSAPQSLSEGTPIWLRVVDNGEGKKSPRDLARAR